MSIFSALITKWSNLFNRNNINSVKEPMNTAEDASVEEASNEIESDIETKYDIVKIIFDQDFIIEYNNVLSFFHAEDDTIEIEYVRYIPKDKNSNGIIIDFNSRDKKICKVLVNSGWMYVELQERDVPTENK